MRSDRYTCAANVCASASHHTSDDVAQLNHHPLTRDFCLSLCHACSYDWPVSDHLIRLGKSSSNMEHRPPESAAADNNNKAFQFLVRSCTTVLLHGSKTGHKCDSTVHWKLLPQNKGKAGNLRKIHRCLDLQMTELCYFDFQSFFFTCSGTDVQSIFAVILPQSFAFAEKKEANFFFGALLQHQTPVGPAGQALTEYIIKDQ